MKYFGEKQLVVPRERHEVQNSAVFFQKSKNYQSFKAEFLYFGIKLLGKNLYKTTQQSFLFKMIYFTLKSVEKCSCRVVAHLPMFQQRNALKYDDLQVNIERHRKYQKFVIDLSLCFISPRLHFSRLRHVCRVKN